MATPQLKVKLLEWNAQVPKRMTEGSAGLDLFVVGNYNLFSEDITMIRTGIAVSIPKGYHGEIHIRSSWGRKGLRLANCTGIIDSDYRGELILMVRNDNKHNPYWVPDGMRIAQLVLVKDPKFDIKVVDELDETERADGGFGSTDEKGEDD